MWKLVNEIKLRYAFAKYKDKFHYAKYIYEAKVGEGIKRFLKGRDIEISYRSEDLDYTKKANTLKLKDYTFPELAKILNKRLEDKKTEIHKKRKEELDKIYRFDDIKELNTKIAKLEELICTLDIDKEALDRYYRR